MGWWIIRWLSSRTARHRCFRERKYLGLFEESLAPHLADIAVRLGTGKVGIEAGTQEGWVDKGVSDLLTGVIALHALSDE